MKRIQKVVLTLFIISVLFNFVGCKKKGKESKLNDGKISVIATIFSEYDWVRQIAKGSDKVHITLLLDKGIDMHSFQPSADDIMKLATCDLFIYAGGESDQWVKKALKECGNKNITIINLLEALGDLAKEEEIIEGMEEHDHDHEHEHEHEDKDHHESDHDHEHEDKDHHESEHDDGDKEYDEHVWLSLKNAKLLCAKLTEALCKVDSSNKTLYENNLKDYVSKIDNLDSKYKKDINNSTKKTVLFGDRFPFRYLMDDYNIKYYAAFPGCSAESEASFDTIIFLSKKVDELGLKHIFKIEGSDGKIALKIAENTKDKNQEIVTMDSMQSVTSKDIENGTNYIDIMSRNLDVLTKALM